MNKWMDDLSVWLESQDEKTSLSTDISEEVQEILSETEDLLQVAEHLKSACSQCLDKVEPVKS
jgi:hypothetical protein